MPEYLAPGVYVEEVDSGPKPIEGVSTSTSGMVGVTERGPVNVPTLVTGIADFRRQFGWYLDRRVFTGDTWYLPHAVKGFFDNGGRRLYVVRVLPNGTNGATFAETQLFDRGENGIGFSTKLASRAEKDEKIILVENDTGIVPGNSLLISDSAASEYRQVAPSSALGVFDVVMSFAFPHKSGAVIAIPKLSESNKKKKLQANAEAGTSTIELDDRTDLAAGSILRLRKDDEDEYVIVDEKPSDSNAGVVKLRTLLRRSYDKDQEVLLMTDNGQDASSTTLSRAANPGERRLVLKEASGYTSGSVIRLEASDSSQVEYHQLAEAAGALIVLDKPLRTAHAAGSAVLGRSPVLRAQAIDRGAWGNYLRVTVNDDDPILETRPVENAVAGNPTLKLQSVVGVESGTVLEFYRIEGGVFQSLFLQKVESVSFSDNKVGFGPRNLAHEVSTDMRVRTREFKMTIDCIRINQRTLKEEVVPGMTETLRQLSMDPRHTRYAVRVAGPIPRAGLSLRADGRTEGESDFIRLEEVLPTAEAQATLRIGPDILTETLPNSRTRVVGRLLEGGNDRMDMITDNTYIGTDAINPLERTGLYALKNIEEISIVAIPGRTGQTVQQELITHCELMRYRFAVLDSRVDDGVAEVQEQRGLYDSKYAGIYYPCLRIADPNPDNPRVPGEISIPPSGHVMGIYARSDIERGVHKAPANEVIRGISGLEVKLTKEEQDILNPRNINCLRDFQEMNRGRRVWGARTISSDPDWKYVNVRRLFIFVEHSIDRGTQFVVFEPNNEQLWERVRRVVSQFLNTVWRNGALMGRTPEEAFFVKADRTTMTQNDIDNGRLIIHVGVAPVKPAEFVIFRISQFTGGSESVEV